MSDDADRDAARRLGRRGGLARAQKLTPERRREIAAQGAAARWGEPESTPERRECPKCAYKHPPYPGNCKCACHEEAT